MALNRTVQEKIGDAHEAFEALREELTPPYLRQMLAALQPNDPADAQQAMNYLQGGFALANLIMANDRTAMQAAVNLVNNGIRREADTL